MNLKFNLTLTVLLLSCAYPAITYPQAPTEETLTITTYYPAPYGVYNELRSKRMAIGDTWFNAANFCWAADSSCGPGNIHADADLVVEGNVGIGTMSPGYKLDINNGDIRLHGRETIGGLLGELIFESGVGAGRVAAIRSYIPSGTGGVDYADLRFYTTNMDVNKNVERMRITNAGNVGIGTTNPIRRLQISGATNPDSTLLLDSTVNNGTTGAFLAFTRSGVFQKYIALEGTNNLSIVQGSGSDDSPANRMYMRFYIDGNIGFGNGKVGIGTTSLAARLTIRGSDGDANDFLRIEGTGGGSRSIYIFSGSELRFNNGSTVGFLDSNSNWVSGSDRAYKKDIIDMSKYGLDTIMLMKPRQYKMRDTDSSQIGFIAQEIRELIPEVVSGEEGQLGIAYGNLTAVLAKAIQEQQKQIEELKAENEKLEYRLKFLEKH